MKKTYTPGFKAKMVKKLETLSCKEIKAKYGVDSGMVYSWRKKGYGSEGALAEPIVDGDPVAYDSPPKRAKQSDSVLDAIVFLRKARDKQGSSVSYHYAMIALDLLGG